MEGQESNYVRGVSPELRLAAAQLRGQMTPAEQVLWEALREKKLAGLRFRAQHPVGQFILDFYCPACKLGIELDGSVHDNTAEEDAARTAHLEAYGYRVLRFQNSEVLTEIAAVLARILAAAREAAPEAPPPQVWGAGRE